MSILMIPRKSSVTYPSTLKGLTLLWRYIVDIFKKYNLKYAIDPSDHVSQKNIMLFNSKLVLNAENSLTFILPIPSFYTIYTMVYTARVARTTVSFFSGHLI